MRPGLSELLFPPAQRLGAFWYSGPVKTVTAKGRQAWRVWLRKHHATETEIWLLMFKKHTGKASVTYLDSLKEALCFGWIDTRVRRVDDERYVTRFSPRRPQSQWSTTNVKLYRELDRAGLMTEAGRRVFRRKSRVYTPVAGKHAYAWHQAHQLGKQPTLRDRISWHREHQKHCGCRPIPQNLRGYFERAA